MAFPTVASSSHGNTAGNATTLAATMPTGVASGDLLLMLVGFDGAGDSASITGWTGFGNARANAIADNGAGYWLYRVADGTEGATQTITITGGIEWIAYACYRIAAANWHGTSAPEAAVLAGASSSTTPNPPSLSPSWGTEDTLYIVGTVWDGTPTLSAYPTNYANNQVSDVSVTSTGFSVAIASNSTGTQTGTEDPGTFTLSASEQWAAFTVAVRPAAASGTLYTPATMNGGLSFSGGFAKRDNKPLIGGLSFSGAFAKQARKALASSFVPWGDLMQPGRTIFKVFAGGLTSSGSLAATRTVLKALAGGLSFSGAFSKRVNKPFAGGITPSAAFSKRVAKPFSAVIHPFNSFGEFGRQTNKVFAASITPSGVLSSTRTILKALAGGLSFSGTIAKRSSRSLSATLTSSGVVSRRTARSLTGGLSFSGAVSRRANKALAGGLSFGGSLARNTSRALAGAVSFVGSLSRSFIGAGIQYTKSLTGGLSFSGSLSGSKVLGLVYDVLERFEKIVVRYPWYRGGIRRR